MASEYDPNRRAFSLYVGDLHPLAVESNIRQFFSSAGEVIGVKICRDLSEKRSLGYAYVNFRTHAQAQNAIESLNYEPLLNRPVRIMWANRDPNVRNSGKNNLFVKNLGPSVTQRQLHDSCELFGKVLSSKIATDENGRSKGFGFVHFADEAGYKQALEFLNKYPVEGKYIYAGPFIPKYERKSLHDPSKFNNCFIKNFGESLDDDKLRKMFEPYGKIISAVVMKDETGKSKGFGFVCFESSDDAKKACEELNNKEVDGNNIYVGKAIKKEQRLEEVQKKQEKIKEERKSKYSKCVNLYIKNLDVNFTDEDLHNAFSKYGDIVSAKIMRHENGKSRGFGFVCFKEEPHAALAVSEMKNQMINNRPLYVAIAQRKEEREKKMYEIFNKRCDELNHPAINFYQNPMYNQAGIYRGSQVIQNRRTINPMSQALAMNTNNYVSAHPNNLSQINYMRTQSRFPMTGNPSMSQNLVGQGVRPVSARPGFTSNPQMNTRLMGNPLRLASGNVQYNQNARNVSIQPTEEKKHRLGSRLMPIVSEFYPEEASRITGVLLSMDPNVLEKLMEDENQLKARIESTRERILAKEGQAKKAEGN